MTAAWEDPQRMFLPDHEVAGALPLDAVLGRTSTLSVLLLAARVFSIGIELELSIRLRRVAGGAESSLMHHERGPMSDDDLDDVMHLVVVYPDGRTASASVNRDWHDAGDQTPTLHVVDGHGTSTTKDSRHWLTPLPPPGDLTIVFSWPYRGVPETRTVIPAADLAEARARVIELWPYEPDPEMFSRP